MHTYFARLAIAATRHPFQDLVSLGAIVVIMCVITWNMALGLSALAACRASIPNFPQMQDTAAFNILVEKQLRVGSLISYNRQLAWLVNISTTGLQLQFILMEHTKMVRFDLQSVLFAWLAYDSQALQYRILHTNGGGARRCRIHVIPERRADVPISSLLALSQQDHFTTSILFKMVSQSASASSERLGCLRICRSAR